VTASIESPSMGSQRAAIGWRMGSLHVRRGGVAALVAVCVGWAISAAGQNPEAVRFVYDVPAPCPSESDFVDMVARDGGQFVRAPGLQSARTLRVHVEGTDPVHGRLVLRGADGSEAVREIDGARCDDVVRSLAVLVALSVEPTVPTAPESRAPVPGLRAPAGPSASASAPGSGAAPGLASASGEAGANREVESSPDSSELRDVSDEWRSHQGLRVDVSGGFTLSGDVSPSSDPAFAAYVEVLDETPRFLAPSIRVGVELAPGESILFTTFSKVVGRVDACPLRGMLARPWSDDAFTLQACARIDVGRLQFGNQDPGAVEARRLWIAPAGLLRLRWTSPRFFGEVEGGISFPLVRESLSVDGQAPEFEIPSRAATTGLAFGVFIL
jgi:hypothetical protein